MHRCNSDKIDPAVLRTGRIDKLIYVPLPDVFLSSTFEDMKEYRKAIRPNHVDSERIIHKFYSKEEKRIK